MTPNLLKKSPTEYFSHEVDFTSKLRNGDKIVGCSITAQNVANGLYQTNWILGNPSGTISSTGKRVSYLLRNGVLGEDYIITFICTTAQGDRVEDKFTLMIR